MAVNKRIPKSRLMIQYDTRVEGEPKKKELPYRLLVIGDLSKGKSKDAQMEFEDRPLRVVKNGLDSTLRDMKISAKMNVPNSINPSKSPMLDIDYKFYLLEVQSHKIDEKSYNSTVINVMRDTVQQKEGLRGEGFSYQLTGVT